MNVTCNAELIARATAVLNPVKMKDRLFGDVGAAVLSEAGEVFTGVAVDTAGWGLCAERSALAAMITAGQYKIAKVVAVWRDETTGKLYVLPPCGICREFMRSIDEVTWPRLSSPAEIARCRCATCYLCMNGRRQNRRRTNERSDHHA